MVMLVLVSRQTAEAERTQASNLRDALAKVQEMFDEAAIEPKTREQWEGIGDKGKRIRKKMKDRRKNVKENRRSRGFDD